LKLQEAEVMEEGGTFVRGIARMKNMRRERDKEREREIAMMASLRLVMIN